MRILVVSAHPDDEVIGAGGTLARHIAEGDEVSWCIVTEGYAPQWSEDDLAAARRQIEDVREYLGFSKVFRLGYPTVRLNTIPHGDLAAAIREVVDEVQPTQVYTTPGTDINLDHRIVYDATLVATRPLPGNGVKRVMAYEIGPTARYGYDPQTMNMFVDISDYLDRKLETMALYQAELRAPPHPRSLEGLELIARERGLAIGTAAAECFTLVRDIR